MALVVRYLFCLKKFDVDVGEGRGTGELKGQRERDSGHGEGHRRWPPTQPREDAMPGPQN